jgi:hypothetical protein
MAGGCLRTANALRARARSPIVKVIFQFPNEQLEPEGVMKTRATLCRFQVKLLSYGNSYYIDRIAELESALRRKPKALQLEMIGDGEIPADTALLIRSILMGRSPKTRLISSARSSLQNGAVLVWLMGDVRTIRDDARLYLRRVDLPDEDEVEPKQNEPSYRDSYSEIDPEEADYAQVLQIINEYLPVKELVGRIIRVPLLKQFGLVENEHVDVFLATAFGKSEPALVAR